MSILKLAQTVVISVALAFSAPASRDEVRDVFEKRQNVVVLLYHNFLAGSTVPKKNISSTTNAEKFESDIVTLLSHGYKSISLNDMYENKNDSDQLYFVITFDDGYLSNYEIAYPILQKYNCYADIFINTDNEFMSHHFSFEQAREMEKSGLISIHSHFNIHADVCDYSNEYFAQNLHKSFNTLNKNLGRRKFNFFAYPYGCHNEEKHKVAKDSGVKLQFIQEPIFDSNDFIIRTYVSYDTDITLLLKSAYLN